uniref:Uncharacterized protein n=1 Tax=Arundo donax TaxID=35708 RepID=A0A0A9A3K4_ARUDO
MDLYHYQQPVCMHGETTKIMKRAASSFFFDPPHRPTKVI